MKLRHLSLLVPLVAACYRPDVVRVVGGLEQRGRFVPAYAYAEYARGAWAEARGDRPGALAAYRAAVSRDGDSVELWTRIGALECEGAASEEAFDRAEELDADYAPLWEARSDCTKDPDDAVSLAERAFTLDAGSAEITLGFVRKLLARAQKQRAQKQRTQKQRTGYDRAGVVLQEWLVTHPDDREAWKLVAKWADGVDDAAWRARAKAQVAALTERWERRPSEVPADARRALRAIADGNSMSAKEQLSGRVGAEPEDTTARLVLALALDLEGERDALGASMAAGSSSVQRQPNALARFAFAEVLARHVGAEAVQLWLGKQSESAATDDAAMRQRWRALLDQPGDAGER